jgi:hypothetical protein
MGLRADDGLVNAAIPPILSAATSAIELSDCRIRRARMVVFGSMVSSLSLLSRCEPDAALHQPSCPIFDRRFTAFDRFYFSLHFKHKRNLPACDVQFVPKYRPAGLSAPLRQMPPVRDALPHLSGRIGFDGLHFGVTITLRRI